MTELLTAAQMRAIEKAAIDSGEVTGLELMERAGQGVVEAIFEEWPELDVVPERGAAHAPQTYLEKDAGSDVEARRAVVLCGPGNNGGDGFVVARLLHQRGWVVEVFLYGDAEKLPPDARVNYDRWLELGVVERLSCDVDYALSGTCVLVDALFGIGMSRPIASEVVQGVGLVPHNPLGEVFRYMCDCVDVGDVTPIVSRIANWPIVVAVDFPSGVSSDTGDVLMPENGVTYGGSRAWCSAADLTVTFHSPKVGHFNARGPEHCGRITICDIGLRKL